MKKWVHKKIHGLLDRVSEQIDKAIPDPGEDCVHDLRTSIRRTRESLSVFGDFFPTAGVKKVRKELREVMHTAAEIRNRDITLELLAQSGVPSTRLRRSLEGDREGYRQKLVEELHDIKTGKTEARWKDELGL